jgi:PspA-Associated protein
MIVRILGEGQLRVDDAAAADLHALDADVEAAVERNDQAALAAALGAMLARARRGGTALPPDSLEPSDVIIPHEDATIEEVRKLLTDEGLIPG